MFKTEWIWNADWNSEDNDHIRKVLFRKEMNFDVIPKSVTVKVSADSRYKLFINGTFVEYGPSKGDRKIWYYDLVDITPYLLVGKNCIAIEVLRYPQMHSRGNHSIFRTGAPGLFLELFCENENGKEVFLTTDDTWKSYKELTTEFKKEPSGFAPLFILEEAIGDEEINGWKIAGYNDEKWTRTSYQIDIFINKADSPGNMVARTIPYMYRKARPFSTIQEIRQSNNSKQDWSMFIQGEKDLYIEPKSHEIIEISAGELMTGFLRFALAFGKGSTIRILQSEAYVEPPKKGDHPFVLPKKGDRCDSKNGVLHGFTDQYTVGGYGTNDNPETYEPFWFRTFRFIRLEIITAEVGLLLHRFDYEETGYPLNVLSWVKTSDVSMDGIWDISERSLRRCMQETYVDCPFYEQLQYAMDTRSQILYTYATAYDDRLARKCFDDFMRSQRYDGMINCSYPSYGPNVIPGFGIYYILMFYDHMMYFGDATLLRNYLPTIERILLFFDNNLDERNLVKKIGGPLFRSTYWSFIDWTEKWNETTGVPTAQQYGSITMESLLYIMGLEAVIAILQFVGRTQDAEEYIRQRDRVKTAIHKYCMNADGMIQDGPGIEEYSQHCQVFGVLTDVYDADEGRYFLEKVLEDRDKYAQCSVAMAFYMFRALEKCELYEKTDEQWNVWRDMLRNNLTTCVEDPVGQRSDCHAWGALALYELPSVVLGVRPTKPGYQEFEVRPIAGTLQWAEGEVITPHGLVYVRWDKDTEGHTIVDYVIR